MSGSKRPDPDPLYAELYDECRKHGLRVGLKTTLYKKGSGEIKSSLTHLVVASVLREERESVVQVALGKDGLPDAAKKALKYLREKNLVP